MVLFVEQSSIKIDCFIERKKNPQIPSRMEKLQYNKNTSPRLAHYFQFSV